MINDVDERFYLVFSKKKKGVNIEVIWYTMEFWGGKYELD